jgi:hypothetical protein
MVQFLTVTLVVITRTLKVKARDNRTARIATAWSRVYDCDGEEMSTQTLSEIHSF